MSHHWKYFNFQETTWADFTPDEDNKITNEVKNGGMFVKFNNSNAYSVEIDIVQLKCSYNSDFGPIDTVIGYFGTDLYDLNQGR